MKTIAQAEAYEAKIVRAQAQVQQRAENVFVVSSSRKGVAPHVVTTDSEGNATWCTCEWTNERPDSWVKYHKCHHAQGTERFCQAAKAEVEAASIAAAIQAVDAIVAEDEQEAEVVAAVAEAQAIVTATKPVPEYVRLASGGLVQKSAQKRYRWRGTFDLYR